MPASHASSYHASPAAASRVDRRRTSPAAGAAQAGDREIEGGRQRLAPGIREKESKRENRSVRAMQGYFYKYLSHMACHVGFGFSSGTFGTSDGTLNTV